MKTDGLYTFCVVFIAIRIMKKHFLIDLQTKKTFTLWCPVYNKVVLSQHTFLHWGILSALSLSSKRIEKHRASRHFRWSAIDKFWNIDWRWDNSDYSDRVYCLSTSCIVLYSEENYNVGRITRISKAQSKVMLSSYRKKWILLFRSYLDLHPST